MSGLEPIAALSLACNILQLVELGRQTIRCIKALYQGGKADTTLGKKAAVLEELTNDVKNHSKSQPVKQECEESTPVSRQLLCGSAQTSKGSAFPVWKCAERRLRVCYQGHSNHRVQDTPPGEAWTGSREGREANADLSSCTSMVSCLFSW